MLFESFWPNCVGSSMAAFGVQGYILEARNTLELASLDLRVDECVYPNIFLQATSEDFDNDGYLTLSDLRTACDKFKIPNSSALARTIEWNLHGEKGSVGFSFVAGRLAEPWRIVAHKHKRG